MAYEAVALLAGILLLVVAILGGGITGQFNIPVLPPRTRQLMGLLGSVFIVLSYFIREPVINNPIPGSSLNTSTPTITSTITASATPTQIITSSPTVTPFPTNTATSTPTTFPTPIIRTPVPVDIDTDQFYRLTNIALSSGRSLDTAGSGLNEPMMADSGNYTGQKWRLVPVGGGYYRLINYFLGEGRSLDSFADGSLGMSETGNFTGQYWKLTPLGDGRYRLTNQFFGDAWSLDTQDDAPHRPVMKPSDDSSGQYWILTLNSP